MLYISVIQVLPIQRFLLIAMKVRTHITRNQNEYVVLTLYD